MPGPARRSLHAGGLALAVAVAALGCGPTGGTDAGGEPVATSTVDLPRSYRFAPSVITVPAGTTVTWTNNDAFTHTVAFDGAEPLRMRPGEASDRTFADPGEYAYVCSLHPTDMQGRVIVT